MCHKSFKNKYILLAHVRSIHDTENIKCSMCNETFNSQQRLRRHISDCHGPRQKCHLCPKTFSKKSGLNAHLKRHKNKK